ncbi:hypothetical protein NQ318_002897 [Aromia moschata]|uniref:RRM domain-containing protein n=1 Tax=Aromia moschata TaxID=1265417 RepID=A0AAV8X8B4_9CUCU|nr:hypothetical protein NQ318_002897 [Aromia moschata]
MGSNNYMTPYILYDPVQPPPNFNPVKCFVELCMALEPDSRCRDSTELQNRTASSTAAISASSKLSTSASRTVAPVAPVTPVNTQIKEQQAHSYYGSSTPNGHYHSRRYSNSTSPGQYNGSVYSPQSGQYQVPQMQYNSGPPGQYMNNLSPGYNRNYYNKRKSEIESENLKKSNKKEEETRKDWSVEDAKRALTVEKDYNKRNKSQSLIIKFPDLELNRDIVSKFSTAIESVHFQQPSTPRFCFVTLNEAADPEAIIRELNRTPFGQGFLTAEYKKDREDEINIGPEDIDPLTLYVGNLAQEVTKEDMVNTYPKQKRIDIGYAKKMKYTRYAFVSFKSVDDSIEAFQKTHATQMYSKSLIVRFRRLNGTVGMPGEPKPQMPQRNDASDPHNGLSEQSTNNHNDHSDLNSHNDHNDSESHNNSSEMNVDPPANSRLAPWEMVDVSNWETSLKVVKEEPPDDSEEEDDAEQEKKPPLPPHESPFMPGCLDVAFAQHKPKVKVEVKEERESREENVTYGRANSVGGERIDLADSDVERRQRPTVEDNSNDCVIITPDKIKKETDKTGDGNTYNSLRLLNRNGRSIEFPAVSIKREVPTPTQDEMSNDCEGDRVHRRY